MNSRWVVSTLAVTLCSLAAFGQTSAPASQPTATEYTLPQEDEIYRLIPQDNCIFYLCADKDQPKQEPGGPPVRKSYATYMRYDIKTGTVTNVLAMIPGRFDAGKLKVWGFDVSPDGQHAVMKVNSASGSSLGGTYMVDLKTQKARKFLPQEQQQGQVIARSHQVLWCGKEVVMPVYALAKAGGVNGNVVTSDRYNTLQPVRYSITGARLGNLPMCGHVWASNPAGDTFVMVVNPQAIKEPLTDATYDKIKLVVITKTGKIQTIIPVEGGRGTGVVYSANLKYGSTQAANITGAKPMKGGGGMPLNAVAFSLDGKATMVELPEPNKPTGPVWVGDDGMLVSKLAVRDVIACWSPKGEKLWSVDDIQAVAVHKGCAYYIQKATPKVIKVKPLVEKAE